MATFTHAEVRRIADLARLAFSDAEAERLAQELDHLLAYVAQLNELDTRAVEPTAHALPLATPLRPDEPEPPLAPELAFGNAPQREGTAFFVPKVIDGDEG